MSTRTYPYTGWVLQPSFKPVEVTFVKQYASFGGNDYGDQTASGKVYRRDEIHPTKEAAIAAGWEHIERIQADLDKRNENLRKKRETLTKAQGKTTT